MKIFTIGIIGAGLQANRRIPAIQELGQTHIVGITSKTIEHAENLAKKYSIPLVKNWETMVHDPTIDIIVITSYPDSHAAMAIQAMHNGKHVLCEKPLAKNREEAEQMVQAADRYKRILKCGFNHRFHPAIMEAKHHIDKKTIGKILFGRGVYGHCARPGFENEWRANEQFAAGGILMEQGIHLIDIFRWFLGNFHKISAFSDTIYFPIAPLEDSAFVLLKTKKNQTVSIQSSNMQWKNTFLLEVYGTEGYIKIDGLGASYGTETLRIGKKKYSGPFTEKISEYRGSDRSWNLEWEDFISAIDKNSQPNGNGIDGLEAMKIVFAAYSAAKNTVVLSL